MMKFKKFTAWALAGVFLVPNAGAANGNVLLWEDLADPTVGVTTSQLREQRPTPLYDYDSDYDSDYVAGVSNPWEHYNDLEASRLFLGGQQAFADQISSIKTAQEFSEPNPGEFLVSDTQVCQDIDSQGCEGSNLDINANLPVCTPGADPGTISDPCILGLRAISQGQESVALFNRYTDNSVSNRHEDRMRELFVDDFDVASNIEFLNTPGWGSSSITLPEGTFRVPAGSAASLWSFDNDADVGHSTGANSFFVRATLSMFLYRDAGLFYQGLDSTVIPFHEYTVRHVPDPNPENFKPFFHPPTYATFTTQDVSRPAGTQTHKYAFPLAGSSPLSSFDNPQQFEHVSCAFEELTASDDMTCGVALKVDDDTRYELQLMIPKELGGWFHGRVADANLSLDTDVNNSLNLLTVAGQAVDVPTASFQFRLCSGNQVDTANSTYWELFYPEDERREIVEQRCADMAYRGLADFGYWSAGSQTAIQDFTSFEALVGQSAKGNVNMWSFGTLPFSGESIGCDGYDGLRGMISTNAMVYQAGLPDLVNGELRYQVAGTRYEVDGETEVQGDYTLVMRSEDARCIYGIGDEPINVSVNVTDANGVLKPGVFTSVVDEEGWLTLKARNFSFSAPIISVGLPRPGGSGAAATVQKATVLPRLSGIPRVGSSISVSEGSWFGTLSSNLSYQWYACEANVRGGRTLSKASKCKEITGATSKEFTPLARHKNSFITAGVTSNNGSQLETLFAPGLGFKTRKILDYTKEPRIALTGNKAVLRVGKWSFNKPSVKYSWYVCSSGSEFSQVATGKDCQRITGEKSKSYKTKAKDSGGYLVGRLQVRKGSQLRTVFTESRLIQ
jgi:hypothetical protein